MPATRGTLLVYGYGNPARGDDGLGPAVASALDARAGVEFAVESNYQLELEDAALLARFDQVVFVDADVSGPAPFWFDRVRPASRLGWTSHGMTPEALVCLAKELFGCDLQAYTLGIRGYEFGEFSEKLSHRAQQNLDRALRFLTHALHDRSFDQCIEPLASRPRPSGPAEPETPRDIVNERRKASSPVRG